MAGTKSRDLGMDGCVACIDDSDFPSVACLEQLTSESQFARCRPKYTTGTVTEGGERCEQHQQQSN